MAKKTTKTIKKTKKVVKKRKKAGAPTLYKNTYPKRMFKFFNEHKLEEYINEDAASSWNVVELKKIRCGKYPTFFRFAKKLWVNESTIYERKNTHPEFSKSFEDCKVIQKEFLIQNTLNWTVASNVWKFLLNVSHWMVEVSKSKVTDETWEKMKWKMDEMKNDIKKLSENVDDLKTEDLQDQLNSIIQAQD